MKKLEKLFLERKELLKEYKLNKDKIKNLSLFKLKEERNKTLKKINKIKIKYSRSVKEMEKIYYTLEKEEDFFIKRNPYNIEDL